MNLEDLHYPHYTDIMRLTSDEVLDLLRRTDNDIDFVGTILILGSKDGDFCDIEEVVDEMDELIDEVEGDVE